MKQKQPITWCSGEGCPLKEHCTYYIPELNKTNTIHFDPVPFLHNRNLCNYFEELEIDLPFILPPTN
jgi:hypothetical protein